MEFLLSQSLDTALVVVDGGGVGLDVDVGTVGSSWLPSGLPVNNTGVVGDGLGVLVPR